MKAVLYLVILSLMFSMLPQETEPKQWWDGINGEVILDDPVYFMDDDEYEEVFYDEEQFQGLDCCCWCSCH